MTDTKSGASIINGDALIKKGYFFDSIKTGYSNLGMDLHVNYHCISQPIFLAKEPHAHPTYEILCFIGGNPIDMQDFGAEIELWLGEEKHIINSTSFVVIPPGVPHCPLAFKKVAKPIVFMIILNTGEYGTIPIPAEESALPSNERLAGGS